MRRHDSIYRQTTLVLQILFVVAAAAALALLAPVDWRRYFGKVRMSGGPKQ
jgi:hypothetical protein